MVLGKRADLETTSLAVTSPSLTDGRDLSGPVAVTVKIRYRSPLAAARIEPAGNGTIRVLFDHPVAGVSPGQAAVFYDGDTVIGGGIIER